VPFTIEDDPAAWSLPVDIFLDPPDPPASTDSLIRVQAVSDLGDLGAAAQEAVPDLLQIAQDENQHPLLRVLAAFAVAKIDPALTSAVLDVLINALNSDDADP
jgi:hypothetical protein